MHNTCAVGDLSEVVLLGVTLLIGDDVGQHLHMGQYF